MAKNILTLNNKDAKTFFIKTDSYFSGELPKYFHFTKMLNNIYKLYEIYKDDIKIDKAKDKDDVDFNIYTNKDGNYAWRKLQIIHPVLYIDLIACITDQRNWETIKNRFNKLHNFSKGNILCTSMPVVERNTSKKNSAKQILEWWETTEQGALGYAQNFPILVTSDISDCYPSIYTHSISWAMHGKKYAKDNRMDTNLLGNKIDKKIQNMQHGQTNGIPQGSMVMNLIAELILAYADCLLYLCLKKNKQLKAPYKILRYRDDYKIFVHSQFDGELIIKELSKVLLTLNLKLNTSKTNFYDNIIMGVIKKDKIYAIENELSYKNGDIYKKLINISNFQQLFQNSRQMAKYLVQINNELRENINQGKYPLIKKEYTINAIIGICITLALKNPVISINCLQIISTILEYLPVTRAKAIIGNIKNRFASVPHSELVALFIQRISIPYKYKEDFSGKIFDFVYNCKRNRQNIDIDLWNNEWLSDSPRAFRDKIRKEKFIHKKIINNMNKSISDDEIDIFSAPYKKI
ncbi:MAG: RNA-directed DNA polymerase [Desulfovibrio sp.]|uniref:RNA-directed DNA polymerase n=1 Tax=Desulfovibrio sp. TaxID=885 RepID=UPI001A6BB9A4|nr:RNA-directed DNA polymerase [Desulfovibrio sp.]MBD5417811.1 RNA-directed DNA polymerase [Desulfovibrio sp.]